MFRKAAVPSSWRRPRTAPCAVVTTGSGWWFISGASPRASALLGVRGEGRPALDGEGASLAYDFGGAVPAQVRGDHERVVVGGPAQHLAAGGAGAGGGPPGTAVWVPAPGFA